MLLGRWGWGGRSAPRPPNGGPRPGSAPRIESKLFDKVDAAVKVWVGGSNAIETSKWSTQEWLRFLRRMPATLGNAGMQRMDSAFHFTKSGNDEILAQWLLMAVKF